MEILKGKDYIGQGSGKLALNISINTHREPNVAQQRQQRINAEKSDRCLNKLNFTESWDQLGEE